MTRKRKEKKMESNIIKEYETDTRWMFPYVDYDLRNYYNFSQLCNEERRRRLPLVLNHQSHTSELRDDLLKSYYDNHFPFKWLASIADISMPTFKNHYTGSILLNHLVEKKNTLFQAIFIETQQIDYHMWLQTSRIKYFGSRTSLKLSIGDVIVGQSWVKKYFKKSDGKIHYGLGKSIITDCGIPVVKFPPAQSMAIDLPEVEIMSDYNRNKDYIAELSYPDYYDQILNRYQNIDIKTLQYIKGNIYTNYKRSNYINYHDRLKQKYQSKITNALENH